MKKLLAIVLAIAIVLVIGAGCTGSPGVVVPEEPEVSPGIPVPEEPEDSPGIQVPEEPEDSPGVSTTEGPLDIGSGFALYGSKVEFDGVYPGWSGTVPVFTI